MEPATPSFHMASSHGWIDGPGRLSRWEFSVVAYWTIVAASVKGEDLLPRAVE
jgi:hypothetical protein